MANEDYLYEWCMFAESTYDSIARLVLEMIIELYMTVRGFAFASCVEFYKQANNNGTQKSNGIRKEVFTKKIA